MTGAVRSRFDALRLLGLAADATERDVRAAFRKLAFATHPDRNAGQDDDFARVRAAYEILRDGGAGAADTPPRPSRPSVEVRVTPVPDEMQRACRALLDARALAAPGSEPAEPGHVPLALRRRGRQVTYLVPTPLHAGTNVVAVPVGELDDPRRIAPKMVRITADRPGPGVVDLAAEVIAPLFPGARGVSIEFGMC